jgi:hypothetical protein
MTPTVYGAHGDVVYRKCGMEYAVTISMPAQMSLDQSVSVHRGLAQFSRRREDSSRKWPFSPRKWASRRPVNGCGMKTFHGLLLLEDLREEDLHRLPRPPVCPSVIRRSP